MSETDDDIILQYTEANRRAWNETARIRHTQQPPAEFFEEFPAEQGWHFAVGGENVELHYLPSRFLLVARKSS